MIKEVGPELIIVVSSSYGASLQGRHPARNCPKLRSRHTDDSPLDPCSWISRAKDCRPHINRRSTQRISGTALERGMSQCHPTLARNSRTRFCRPIPYSPDLGSQAPRFTKVPHGTATFLPLRAACVPTTNSLDVAEGTRKRPELSRRTMQQIIGYRYLRFSGTGVRSHHSAAGCG